MLASARDVLDICESLFGIDTIADIRRIYSSLWGRDTYRWKGQPLEANRIAPERIFLALWTIAQRDDAGRYIAIELAEALRYSSGVTNPQNVMKPISPEMLFDTADLWQSRLNEIDAYLRHHGASALVVFRNVWAEWNTYLDLIGRAQDLTGLSDVDSFSGIASTRASHPHRLDCEWQAHDEYEKADLIAFKNLNKLMRMQPTDIEEMLRGGRWTELLQNMILAYLFGEGRFYQSLRLLIVAYLPPQTAKRFFRLFRAYAVSFQTGYRCSRPIDEIDIQEIKNRTECFFQRAQPVPLKQPIDFDEAWIVRRQRRMRLAENHLRAVESKYSRYQPSKHTSHSDPADLYGQAMTTFAVELEQPGLTAERVGDILSRYRQALVDARTVADATYQHDYYFWRADGELLQQVKSRSLHPRYQLYHVEAYAERLYLAAFLALRDCQHGYISIRQFYECYQEHFNFDEASLYTQQWIATYGPRRATLFGHEAPPTVSENADILAQDKWIYKTRVALQEHGASKKLWGAIVTGYTERLRHLILQFSTPDEIAALPLAALVDAGEITRFTHIVQEIDPYDREDALGVSPAPLVTVGVHVHNADPKVIFETLIHVREIIWPHHVRWSLLGTTTNQIEIARMEHQFALRLGITRFGMTNRQLLKAGNQNRIIPNTPAADNKESCYLTLDDDYVMASLAVRRAVPILLQYPEAHWIQFNLLLRASIEPGHTYCRHFDALGQHSWTMTNVFSFQDTEITLPLGTNTLFRTTRGKNELAITGGFVVDPRYVVNGEDFAHGVASYAMHLRPDLFAESPEVIGAVEQSWQYGIYIPEVWAIGDGVDFGPGNHRQKSRYAEINTRIFRSIWLPFLWRNWRNPSRRFRRAQPAAVFLLTYQLSEIYLTMVSTAFAFLITPALAFTPYFDNLHIDPYLALDFCVLWSLWFIVCARLRKPLHQIMGLSLVDVFEHTWMVGYGSFFAWTEGWIKGAFFRTANKWSSYKGTQQANRFRVLHLIMCVFHIAAAFYATMKGLPLFLFLILSSLMFGLVWFLQEWPPATPQEKIAKLARDTHRSFIKQILNDFTYSDFLLGAPAGAAPPRQIWLLQYFIAPILPIMLILFAIFSSGLPLFFRLVLGATSILNFLTLQIPLWNQTRTLERRQELQQRVSGTMKSETAQRIVNARPPFIEGSRVFDEVTELFVG